MNKDLEKAIRYRFEQFVESAIENGDVELVSNDVPYGDTWVNEGDYIEEEDMEVLKTDFICALQDDGFNGCLEILEDEGIDKTSENIKTVLRVANEIL